MPDKNEQRVATENSTDVGKKQKNIKTNSTH
jgi:hypothetical protein